MDFRKRRDRPTGDGHLLDRGALLESDVLTIGDEDEVQRSGARHDGRRLQFIERADEDLAPAIADIDHARAVGRNRKAPIYCPAQTAVAPDDAIVMREIRNGGARSVLRTDHINAATAMSATTEATIANDQDRASSPSLSRACLRPVRRRAGSPAEHVFDLDSRIAYVLQAASEILVETPRQ